MRAVAAGQAADVRDILAAVTPGGGKSLLPVIAAAPLISARIIDRVCWEVPRDTLRLQAEEAFADPSWRRTLGHSLVLRTAHNTADPSRGLAEYGQGKLPLWLLDQLEPSRDGITALRSNALAMRFSTLRLGPDLAMQRPEQRAAQSELLEAPSVTEKRLRARLGEMVAAQAVKDEAGRAGFRGGVAGPGLYHRYNAALKRVSGNKSRAEMTLAELDAAFGWLERNRLSEKLRLLDDDPRYAWKARKRGEWKPPVGRYKRSPSSL